MKHSLSSQQQHHSSHSLIFITLNSFLTYISINLLHWIILYSSSSLLILSEISVNFKLIEIWHFSQLCFESCLKSHSKNNTTLFFINTFTSSICQHTIFLLFTVHYSTFFHTFLILSQSFWHIIIEMISESSEKEQLQRLKIFFRTENNNNQDVLVKFMKLLLKQHQLLLFRDDKNTLQFFNFKKKIWCIIWQCYIKLKLSFVHILCEDFKVKEKAFKHLDFFTHYQQTLIKKNHVNYTVRKKTKALNKNHNKHWSNCECISSCKDKKHRHDWKHDHTSLFNFFNDDNSTFSVQDKRQNHSQENFDLESVISTLIIKWARDQLLDISSETKQDRFQSWSKRRRVKCDFMTSLSKSKAVSWCYDSHKFNIIKNNDDHSEIDNSFIKSQLVSDLTDVISHKSKHQQAELSSVKDHFMSDAFQSHLDLNEESFWSEH